MKAFRILVTRDITESVIITVPATSKNEAFSQVEEMGFDVALEKYGDKDNYGNVEWETHDPSSAGDIYFGDPKAADEVELCDKCGEVVVDPTRPCQRVTV